MSVHVLEWDRFLVMGAGAGLLWSRGPESPRTRPGEGLGVPGLGPWFGKKKTLKPENRVKLGEKMDSAVSK